MIRTFGQITGRQDTRPSAYQRGYTGRWQRQRRIFLMHNPLCVACLERGIYTAANTVDHIKPHRGNKVLFWDKANWQALCTACHNLKTAKGQ